MNKVLHMPLVVIESPYAGDTAANLKYAHKCVEDCLARGESPYASHIMLTTALDDTVAHERALGINAGLAISHRADLVVIYDDLGISSGMQKAIDYHTALGTNIEYRKIQIKGDTNED